jgi:hypothetical protein
MVVVISLMEHLEDRIITFAMHARQTGFSAGPRAGDIIAAWNRWTVCCGKLRQRTGHQCAGQVLGVRMAMLGCRLLGIKDPRGLVHRGDRKRLVTFVEIDRCATDAIAVVTGCRLGKRALKFRD